jgi:rod shape-determining protein MreD
MTLVRLRLPLVVAVAFIIQQTLLSNLEVAGAQPELMFLVVVLVAMEGGPTKGAVVGFAVGLLIDLFVQTPFGLSALTLTLIGYGMGLAWEAVVEVGRWLTPGAAAVGSAGAVVLYAVLDALLGNTAVLHQGLVPIVVVVGAVNGVLAVPGAPIIRWSLGVGARAPVPPGSALGASRWGQGAGVARQRVGR